MKKFKVKELRFSNLLVEDINVPKNLIVRIKNIPRSKKALLEEVAKKKNLQIIRAFDENLKDARMQNVILLAHIAKHKAIPDVETEDFRKAISDLMSGKVLEKNLQAFSSML